MGTAFYALRPGRVSDMMNEYRGVFVVFGDGRQIVVVWKTPAVVVEVERMDRRYHRGLLRNVRQGRHRSAEEKV